MMPSTKPAIWFPTIRTNTGTDRFTEQLVSALNQSGFQAEISWLPHHAEYLPWLVSKPQQPEWANIVHINSWLPARFIPKNLPLVATVHLCVQDPVIRPYKSWAQHLYHQLWITPIEKFNLKQADIITCVSSYTKYKVKDIFNTNNIELVYNGIDTKVFSYKPSVSQNKPFRLLFAGSNSIRKGFDLLPLIMKKLGSNYELSFTASYADNTVQLPENMKAIAYCKTQNEMLHLYHSVDALVFPSRLEGFGLVVAEAMACGLPVIISDNSALSELVNHGVTGFLCPQDNVDAFVEYAQLMASDNVLKTKITDAARQYVEQHFELNRMVKKYLELYNSVLNAP